MKVLLDTNILIYLVNPASHYHQTSRTAVETLVDHGDTMCVAPQTIAEFWNIVTRPSPRGLSWTASQTRKAIGEWESAFLLLDEAPDIYPLWRDRCAANNITGARVFDVRLAVIAEKYDIDKVMTFNATDFASLTTVVMLTP